MDATIYLIKLAIRAGIFQANNNWLITSSYLFTQDPFAIRVIYIGAHGGKLEQSTHQAPYIIPLYDSSTNSESNGGLINSLIIYKYNEFQASKYKIFHQLLLENGHTHTYIYMFIYQCIIKLRICALVYG